MTAYSSMLNVPLDENKTELTEERLQDPDSATALKDHY